MAAFDEISEQYDEHFTFSPIGILQRKVVIDYLMPIINKRTSILEINCGTGHDAIILAPLVRDYLATDISKSMIKIAEEKKNNKNLNNLEFKTADINDIYPTLHSKFDVLFSNFAGLNCLSQNEISLFSNKILPYLNQNGRLILILLSKKCIWENIYFHFKNPSHKHRRHKKFTSVTFGENTFNTYYYSPSEISEIFGENFVVKKVKPVGLFVPPSYMNNFFKNKKLLLWACGQMDKFFGRFGSLSNYSDHFLIELHKK